MTQAPTPGPLDSESVKLLVKGDLLWAAVHGAPVTVIEAVGASVSYRHSEYAPDGCVIVGKGLEWLTFIGRPDSDGWIKTASKDIPRDLVRVEYHVFSDLSGLDDAIVWWRPASFAPTAPVEASGSEREAITHEVKCWREPFAAVKSGAKPWELRLNDRDYRTGDTLRQFEWNEAENCYTGDEVSHRIGWMLKGPSFGLPDGYVVMTLEALRPQPSGFLATLTDEQRSEALSHTGDDTHPQPSGETREAVARLTKDVATIKSFSANIATFYDGPDKRYIRDVAADIEAVLAFLSARPLALGGQQGDHADALEPLRRSISDLKTHIQAVQTAKKEGGPGNTITDCINALPSIVRALEAAEFEVEAAFEDYEDTTPARAEAQDEGAAGESLDDVARRLFAAQYPGRDYDDLKDMVQIGWLRKAHDEILSARAHPSPTPAADADRVRPSLWWNAEDWEVTRCDLEDAYEDATQGEMRGVAKIGNAHEFDPIYAVRIDIDTTGDGEADDYEIKTFPTKEEADAYLAEALKSTAAKEGGA